MSSEMTMRWRYRATAVCTSMLGGALLVASCSSNPSPLGARSDEITRSDVVDVSALAPWNDTGVDVFRDDALSFACADLPRSKPWDFYPDPGIACSGETTVSYWDRSTAPCCPFGSLVGRIGATGPTVCIGGPACVVGAAGCPANCTDPRSAVGGAYTAQDDGRLYLGFNDGDRFDDNVGGWRVTVTANSNTCAFTFDRNAAARTAVRLASHNPYAQSNASKYSLPFHVSFAPFSAMFMSLAYLGGGVPMLRPDPRSQVGWFAQWVSDITIEGNNVWLNHNATAPAPGTRTGGVETFDAHAIGGGRLIGYLTGETGGDLLPQDGVRSFDVEGEAILVPVAEVYQGVTLNPGRLQNVHAGIASRVRRGDYVYLDSAGDNHGLMVMGFGPPISCELDALEATIVDDASLAIDVSRVPASRIYSRDFTVPYVVDWFAWDQPYRRPRPFYCTYHLYNETRIFGHSYWLFVPAPDRGTYQCDAVYQPSKPIPIASVTGIWPAPASVGAATGTVQLGSEALEGAIVTACSAAGACRSATTDATGRYDFSSLPVEDYSFVAVPPGTETASPAFATGSIAAGATISIDLTLSGPVLPPPGTTITAHGTTPSGVPILFNRQPVTLTTLACPGGVGSFTVRRGQSDLVLAVGVLNESPRGTYRGEFGPLDVSGAARVVIAIDCPASPDVLTMFDVYIDPSGLVRNADGTPLAGATVTLLRSEGTPDGPFEPVPEGSALLSPMNRTNPMASRADGSFGWDVVSGYYVVRAEKPGCVAADDPTRVYVESPVLTIPPAVLDLDLRLSCSSCPSHPPARLRLTSMCSPDPASRRVWRVRNPNAFAVAFTWEVHRSELGQSGSGFAAPSGDVFFETVTERGSNTVRLFVDGRLNDVKGSNPARCP